MRRVQWPLSPLGGSTESRWGGGDESFVVGFWVCSALIPPLNPYVWTHSRDATHEIISLKHDPRSLGRSFVMIHFHILLYPTPVSIATLAQTAHGPVASP